MAKKSGSRQLKRERAPAFWPIHRKEATWATRTRPGPHRRQKSLPLVLVVRDILGYAKTAREAIKIVKDSKVKVDGIVRHDHRFPVGLMDVVEIQGTAQLFRVLPKPARGLSLVPIQQGEAGYKLCRIVGKRTLGARKLQVNLHDGRSLLVQGKEGQKTVDEYNIGGTLQLALPIQKVVKYIPFQTGAIGLVTDGKNQGFYGKITSIFPGSYARPKIAKIQTGEESFDTPANYVISVGTDTPLVALER